MLQNAQTEVFGTNNMVLSLGEKYAEFLTNSTESITVLYQVTVTNFVKTVPALLKRFKFTSTGRTQKHSLISSSYKIKTYWNTACHCALAVGGKIKNFLS